MNTAHSQRASVALQKLAELDPAFSSLAVWAHHRDTDGEEVSNTSIDAEGNIKTSRRKVEFARAYTDGRTIYYGTEFGKWTLEQQIAVAAHEITHIAFRHVARGKALAQRLGNMFDPKVFNIAIDAITNEMLRLAGYRLPPNVVYLVELFEEAFGEKISAEDAVGEWDAEKLYMRLMKERKQQCKSGGGSGQKGKPQDGQGQGGGQSGDKDDQDGDQQGQGGGDGDKDGQGGKSAADRAKDYADSKGFEDDIDTSGKLTPEDAQEDNEWRQRVERAMRSGKQAGTGIGKLGHKIADLPKSRTPWELILRRLVNKAVTRTPRPSWTSPARRWIGAEDNARRRGLPTPAFEPGFVKQNTHPRVVIGVDVSGSIGDQELEIFCGEIASIGKKTGAELHVIVFDTQVLSQQKLDGVDFEAEIKKVDFARGGGTSFVDFTNRAEEIDPSIIVVLTDLYGPFRDRQPKCPIIWASAEEQPPEPPYGKLLSLTA